MMILLELDQFGKPDAGKNRFVSALQAARSANKTNHPFFDWLQTRSCDMPALVFDVAAIEKRMRWLSESCRESPVAPLFAVKSCTNKKILELALRELSGFDVSNPAEYALLPDNLEGRLVSVTSPALTGSQDDFRSKGNNLLFTIDSQVQLDRHLSQEHPCDYVLRVQGSELLREASPPDPAYYPATRFGFSLAEVKRLLTAPWMRNSLPVGFHVHHGSEANRLSTYKTMASELKKLAGLLGRPVEYINLGGGWHGLNRHEIHEAVEHVRRLFHDDCRVLIEPGRWFSVGAGYAVGTIVNISRSAGVVRVTLDLSGKSHMHWSTPSLMHFFNPGNDKGAVVQFYGPSCYESDFIGKYYMPYTIDIIPDAGLVCGKQVVFANVSTYSAEWNTAFNGIPEADVVWIRL